MLKTNFRDKFYSLSTEIESTELFLKNWNSKTETKSWILPKLQNQMSVLD